MRITHLNPPSSWCPSFALLSLWSLKYQRTRDRGCLEEGQNPRSSGRGSERSMGSCVARPCPSPSWVSASESANGSKHPGPEAPAQGRPWNLLVLSPPLLWALCPHWLPLLAGLWALAVS